MKMATEIDVHLHNKMLGRQMKDWEKPETTGSP